MRASFDGQVLLRKKKIFFGINLGADFCAEHEWGIKSLHRKLGVPETGIGLEKRRVIKPKVVWFEGQTYVGLNSEVLQYGDKERTLEDSSVLSFIRRSSCEDIYCGWDETSFYILTKRNSKNVKLLKELFEAFQKDDVCVWLGGGGVFNNSGLSFGIISKMSQDVFDTWTKADQERIDTQAWFEKTGIEKYLKDAGKKWFALVPKKLANGTYGIWLNPYQQHIDNYGYFTVEQLKEWAHNKGPVPMKKSQRY